MRNTALFLLFAILTFLIYSCTKDSPFNNNFSEKREIKEGIILVAISDNIENEQMVLGGYEVYFKETLSGDVHEIDFDVNEIHKYISKSGKTVQVEADFASDNIQLHKIQDVPTDQISTRDPGKGNGNGGGNGGGPGGGGNGASVLVAMVSDNASTPNCTAADLEYQLIGQGNPESTANLFSVSSKGKFTIGSVITTEVTINAIRCSAIGMSRDVDPILQSQGFNLNSFDYIIYVTAPVCSYGGQAILGGKIVHNAYCTWEVVNPHEIGHCLNMNHSTAYNANGSVSPYGDPSCIMATSFRELNAPHRIEKGWLKGKNTGNVNSTGTYFLSPLELDSPSEKQVYKVDVGMINFNRPESYYLSYRAPIGVFDNGMSPNVVDKLSIHTWSGEAGWVTRYVGAIDLNEMYADSTNGVIFKNLGIQNEVMSVSVEIF